MDWLIITGSGSSEKVGEESKKLRVKKALIVTDDFLFKLWAVEGVKKALSDNKIPFAIYIQIPSLKELGVDKEKLNQLASKMAEDAIASGSPEYNPRQATKEEIIEVYKIAYSQ